MADQSWSQGPVSRFRRARWSLAGLGALVAVSGHHAVAAGGDYPAFGTRLVLKASLTDTTRKSMTIVGRDPTIGLGDGNDSADDPTIHGAGVTLLSPAFQTNYNLPTTGWTRIGQAGANRGYTYRGGAFGDPIRKAVVKNGKLKVVGRGGLLEHLISDDPDPVDVVFALGSRHSCFRFGGSVVFEGGVLYLARNAAAPAACP
jgi:hypothetical protein